MAITTPLDQPKLLPATQEFIEEFCPSKLSAADVLEIKESLYHLGKAIYLYHLQKTRGGNE